MYTLHISINTCDENNVTKPRVTITYDKIIIPTTGAENITQITLVTINVLFSIAKIV